MIKTNRNQPCPCGSGKRFKHCCGALKQDTLQVKPDLAHLNLGDRLFAQNRFEEAIVSYQQALQLKPDLSAAHKSLGNIFRIQGKLEEAKACFRKVLELNPNDAGTQIKLATLRPVIMGSHQDILDTRRQFQNNVNELLKQELKLTEPEKETGVTNFYFAYHGFNDRDLQIQLAKLYEQACPELLYTAPLVQRINGLNGLFQGNNDNKHQSRKIKIGFISKFFKNHTIGKVMCGLIANLSREKFEVHVFFLPQKTDEIALFIQQNADHFETLPLVLDKARQHIAEKHLDILCYPDIGMDSFTYFLAFSRLAPVQCTTWGHPVTTSIRNIDYYISTHDFEVEGAEEHYSEKLIRLNSQLTYYYRVTLPHFSKVRSDFGLANTDHIYLCPQALFKFHPDFDPILADILSQDDQGQVILVEGNHQHWTELLKKRFSQTIPKAINDRIRFLPRMTLGEYFNLIALSDVMLDPFHFGGGNTTYEALPIGTPIVTLPTQFMRADDLPTPVTDKWESWIV
jgi:predicted O-linked N-acetylglucosamine transferase (SPINDLY family)